MIQAISHSTHCSTTGVTKVMVCTILSVGPLLLIVQNSPCSGEERGFAARGQIYMGVPIGAAPSPPFAPPLSPCSGW